MSVLFRKCTHHAHHILREGYLVGDAAHAWKVVDFLVFFQAHDALRGDRRVRPVDIPVDAVIVLTKCPSLTLRAVGY